MASLLVSLIVDKPVNDTYADTIEITLKTAKALINFVLTVNLILMSFFFYINGRYRPSALYNRGRVIQCHVKDPRCVEDHQELTITSSH